MNKPEISEQTRKLEIGKDGINNPSRQTPPGQEFRSGITEAPPPPLLPKNGKRGPIPPLKPLGLRPL